MIVALVVAIAGLTAACIVQAVLQHRALAVAADERRHLTHIAISRHAGELRTIESQPADERAGERGYVHIEGLA